MKTLKLITLFFAMTAIVGCKKNETINADKHVGIAKDEGGKEILNKSDVAFRDALTSYSKNEYKKAGNYLAIGANELTNEAKAKGSTFTDRLDTSIKHLKDISKQLENGQAVDENGLRSMIADAEINVNHGYLTTDNVYMMTEPEKVNDYILNSTLDHNINNLKEGTAKLDGAAKAEGQKLEMEGKKLKDDFEAWKKRVEEHSKKTETHFKQYQPEYINI